MCSLQVIERYLWIVLFNSHFGEYFITTILASMSIFVYVLKCNINNRFIEKISSYSMPIYFLHVLVMDILSLLSFHILHIDLALSKGNLIINIALALVICIISCGLYDIFKNLFQLLLNMRMKMTELPHKYNAQN